MPGWLDGQISDKARKVASETLEKVKSAIGLNYRDDKELINSQSKKYADLHNNKN